MSDVTTIDLPFIEKNKSRHGTMRYFLRIKGERICRLPDALGSEEFLDQYWAARRKHEAARQPAAPTGPSPISLSVKPNSFKWLSMEYIRSDPFRRLDPTTQAKRRSIIESMWIEPIRPNDARIFADMPVARMTVASLETLRDRKKATPFAADERVKVLRQVFSAKDANGKPFAENIALLVKSFRLPTEGHHTASADDLKQYIEHHGHRSKAVLALSILMFTGIRVSDLALIGPQHRRKDVFKLRLFKGRNRKPVTLEIPIHPILAAVLTMHPPKGMTYLMTEWGKPFSIKSLGGRVSDWFTQAKLPHLTAHSVRKGLATDQAHNGVSDSALEAMFGWRDGKTSKIYTRNAEQARLARIAVSQITWEGLADSMLPADTEGVAAAANGD
jgi:integrase